MEKPKSRQLAVFLIKPEFHNWEDCLKEKIDYDTYDISPELDMSGIIIVGEVREKRPKWLSFLQEGSNEKLKDVYNTSTRALLFINCEERLFAIAFGYGHYMLKEDCYERGFGLKVTLNTVDPSKLRSLDTSNIEELTVQTRKQTSKSSSMNAFGLNILSDLMRMVTGEPLDQTLAVRITGKDALVFNSKMFFRDLKDKIRRFLTAYHSDKYKEKFYWIDNLSEVRDPVILEKLNESLIKALKNRDFDKIHLAPPEIVEWPRIEGFNYSTNKKSDNIYPDLEIEEFINTVEPEKLDLKRLKKCKILVKTSTEEDLIPMWKLYDSIVFETYLADDLYILTMGKWFNIETNFAKTVTDFIRNIPEAKVELPDCRASENETEYNKRAAESMKNAVLMDSILIPCDSARDKIELCDLFTESGQFIHIKSKKDSSTLSHLFAQGRISAESLLQDKKFRGKVRQLITKEKRDLARYFPDTKPNPSDYEVVFAFIDKSAKQLPESLPFFTKLNFMQTTKVLSLLGFKVSKIKIKKQPNS
jgi:uncharacterized protein (TIGR04141 family)